MGDCFTSLNGKGSITRPTRRAGNRQSIWRMPPTWSGPFTRHIQISHRPTFPRTMVSYCSLTCFLLMVSVWFLALVTKFLSVFLCYRQATPSLLPVLFQHLCDLPHRVLNLMLP